MSRVRRRALVCSYNTPQVDRDSGARRVFDTIRMLKDAGWSVSFIAAHTLGDRRYVADLEQIGVPVYDGSKGSMDDVIRVGKFDLALMAFWPVAARYLPAIRRHSPLTRVLIDSIDLHFLREARVALRPRNDGSPTALLDAAYGQRMADEMNAYVASDGVLAISQKEADLINDISGDPTLAEVVPFGESLPPSTVPLAKRKGVLFVGSFAHKPNVQAIEYFCREVLPHFKGSLAGEHPVYVVGNGMTDAVRNLAKKLPHVRMVGWVPSVLPYFEQARISVVPLLTGAGVKGKLVQALMVGTPSVATSIGIEGMGLRADEHVLVADEPKAFAGAMQRLLSDDKTWKRIMRAGREQVLEEYGWETVSKKLMEVIKRVMSRPAKRAMLLDPAKVTDSAGSKREQYGKLVARIRESVARVLPKQASVLVVSKGDDALLELGGRRRGQHFPAGASGVYAGHHPATDDDAVVHLESLRSDGASYLLLPSTAFWWLDHYKKFARHLAGYREVLRDDDVRLYELTPADDAKNRRRAASNGARAKGVNGHRKVSVRSSRSSEMTADDIRLIAFYLPQFHPIPENNEWWGKGFTEWTNVAKAVPQFEGHYQPHIPADLGYYDLRLPQARQAQADLAREYGIAGFCYYHYWFSGKRLLERPFQEVLQSGQPDLPFCLCWANEPWSRRWDGSSDQILQAQSYSAEDDLAHIQSLLPALSDPRAIRIGDKPLFLVYQGHELPHPQRTVEIWRKEVARAGLAGIHLVAVETGWDADWDATKVDFDAKVLFQPQFSLLRQVPELPVNVDGMHVFPYEKAWPVLANPKPVDYTRYDTVFPSWDNCARRGQNGWVLHNSTPDAYEQWLRLAIDRARRHPRDERIVFINAWNEWGEGCHLEPDLRNGRAYLEATRRALHERPKARRARRLVATA